MSSRSQERSQTRMKISGTDREIGFSIDGCRNCGQCVGRSRVWKLHCKSDTGNLEHFKKERLIFNRKCLMWQQPQDCVQVLQPWCE